ncbi:FG-nucleoporin NUP159 [Aspergillus clavatus NRRL 1]|uniref:Nuclear pore complex subunit Nup159, putative n=1 Tax=Aspergillus clavatus (strain ATCC 1007 / CBS 513.65 / DSM 816 / NCTC 3887 / NRRL 1 / QM 1276 / 107) TaxID=344612 RepID=A1CEI2_ASPCL|nr:nuclear pore complex subunit Nup159, putative [Aspergillus clavatus NRRL 1]EAW11281.1 nuclear pore complex subunit Nup159, putative [Aspergillus clavatus NRRL 1]
MAFNLGASNAAGGGPSAELGPELPDVIADEVGFKGVSGDSNVRLLSTPWPEDALPTPTCSLLAVAPTQGILVGAGPNSLAVASSEAVRNAISASAGEGKVKTKPFQPQATIPLPARPTHVAFASGDSALVLATEDGAGLAVYQTTTLLSGVTQPALSIPTNNTTLRVVAPNPTPSEDILSSLVALVTSGGELLMADLKGANLIPGANGQVLRAGVSSICWSNKGKQLVAGLADGTAVQLTPDGTQKDTIPRPSDLEGDCHVSSIAWLENDIFLMVYTSNATEDDMGQTPSSSYYLITRRKGAPFLVQRLPELCMPFGVNRAPAYQFIARLRDYKPHLKDVLIVSSTASTDIGLITRSDQPLASDEAAKGTVGLFTTTEVNDDTKRAALPLDDSSNDTSVIGLGIDLSSTSPVASPIQGEDIAESSTPLPNLFCLNNDGILSSWWLIYSESIRQKLPYHGLVSVNPQQPQPPAQTPVPAPTQPQAQTKPQSQPAFGQSAFGKSAFGSPSPLGASPFGKPSAAPAFGGPSTLGSRQPTFGTPSTPAAPSFGSPSQMGHSFGAPSTLGQAGPQFGKSGFGAPSTPGFGQPSPAGKPLAFGAPSAGSGGGFGSFAGGGGFSSFAAAKPAAQSPFGKPAGESPFGKPSTASPFGKPSGPSPFGAKAEADTAFKPQTADQPKSAFGAPSSGFVLGSTFKGDGTAVNDGPRPEKSSGLFSFATSLDDMVSSPNKTSPPTESMDDTEDQPAQTEPEKPATKEHVPSLFGAPSKVESAKPISLFGAPSKVDTSKPASVFGAQTQPQLSTQATKSFSLFGNAAAEKQITSPLSPPSEKTLVPSSTPTAGSTPLAEPPLPPDPTSRAAYGPGDTSASSNVSKISVEDSPLPPAPTAKTNPTLEDVAADAPLPPDFTRLAQSTKPEKPTAEEAPLPSESPAPESPVTSDREASLLPEESDVDESERELSDEGEESDFADSGEDITHEIDEEEESDATGQTPKISPESSFGAGVSDQSPAEGLFSRISKPGQAPPRQLFGEINKPVFPPKPHASREPPRSPSPVRGGALKSLLKPQIQKSASAPQVPGSTLAARKAVLMEAAQRDSRLRQKSDRTAREEQTRLQLQAQRQEEESMSLSDDDEDEKLRADLAQPLKSVPTLDPFLPHQDYMGETNKPGIPGQIERLYRDINSMIDTLGINSRALSSFLLYQKQSSKDSENWIQILKSDHPADILDEKVLLCEVEKLDDAVHMLAKSLEEQRVQGVEDKLDACRELLSKDILTLRGQCASIRKTLDAHTDTAAILSAPLSAEQANLQQDLRSAFTDIQAKLADLESAVSLLRAKIAEAPRTDGGRQPTKRPTVEAVTSTIATMMNMAESKSSDIDVLEVQLKKLGIDTSGTPGSREGSPFTTPKKGMARLPTTPGSRGSIDMPVSAYHTPDSASRFRSSINGSAKASRLRSIENVGELATREETAQWKSRMSRRQHIVSDLKRVIGEKKSKVRGVDDL